MPMNNGQYRGVLDRIALQQLIVPVYIPNPNLGVDHGEDFQPYNLAYARKTPKMQQSVVLPDPVKRKNGS
jgi:hypothetical protein